MKNRCKSYYREQREKHISRKERIIKSYIRDAKPHFLNEDEDIYDYDYKSVRTWGDCDPYWYVKHKGVLSKGKIHCSCPMCAFHGTTRQDRRTYTKMLDDLEEMEPYLNSGTAETKLKKRINGRWYPKTGMCGTKFHEDNHINLDDYLEGTGRGIENEISTCDFYEEEMKNCM